MGIFIHISWDLYIPKYTIIPLFVICPVYFARMTTLCVLIRMTTYGKFLTLCAVIFTMRHIGIIIPYRTIATV